MAFIFNFEKRAGDASPTCLPIWAPVSIDIVYHNNDCPGQWLLFYILHISLFS